VETSVEKRGAEERRSNGRRNGDLDLARGKVRIAIREWLDAEGAEQSVFHVYEEEVTV